MSPDTVMELGREALTALATVCAPILLVGLAAGLIVSVFQAATQISESTLTFLPKVAAVISAMLIGGNWIIEQLTTFTTEIIQRIGEVGP